MLDDIQIEIGFDIQHGQCIHIARHLHIYIDYIIN